MHHLTAGRRANSEQGVAVLMKIALRTILIPALFLFNFGLSAQDSVEKALENGDPEALIKVLIDQGPDFRLQPQMIQKICDQPEMIQAILDWVYQDEKPAALASAPTVTAVSNPEPERSVLERSLPGDRIMVALDNMRRAGEKEETPFPVSRFMAQTELLHTLFDPENAIGSEFYIKNYGRQNLPQWVADLLDVAVQAKSEGLPTLYFEADKNVSFSLTARDLGVKVSIALFMLHQNPDQDPGFKLNSALIGTHKDFPLVYDSEKKDFTLTSIGQPGHNMIRLGKELNGQSVSLYPGIWGFRLRYATGRDQIRFDQTHYFEVKAGSAYNLLLTRGKGSATVEMTVVPRQ